LREQKRKGFYIIIPLVIITLITLTAASYYLKNAKAEDDIAYRNKILRFHVIANSDSPEDQALKEGVKKEILTSLKPEMSELENVEDAKEFLKDKSEYIEGIAEQKIKEYGKDYHVKAYLDTTYFPVKTYGAITLPAGEYQALRVEIGSAGGSNWWCILFPPLCFVDITQGLTPEKTVQDLQKVLTEKEIESLKTARNRTEIPIEIRFKIVEIFNGLEDRFAWALSKLDWKN